MPTTSEVNTAAANFIADTVTADAKINGAAGTVTDRHGTVTPNLEKILEGVPNAEADAAEAAASATEAAASATEAAASATEAAASATEARDYLTSGNAYLTLDALNTAALADGSRALVWTEEDEKDYYLVTGGAGAWQNKSQPAYETVRTLRAQFPFPADPALYLDPINAEGYGGRVAPGLNGFDTNLYPYSSGQMPAAAGFTGTVTPRYGDGPNGGKTQRIEFGSTSTTFYFFLNRFLEAGDWVASIRVKSAPGAGAQTVRFGELADVTDVAISEAGFTEIQRTITSAGANKSLSLRGDGTNTPDVEVDEVRIHRDDGSVNLPINFGAGGASRDFGLVNTWPLGAGAFEGITNGGILKAPAFPAPANFDQYTFMFALRRDGVPSNTEVFLNSVSDATLGTTGTTFRFQIKDNGELITGPVSSVPNTGPNYCNGDWHMFAVRAKPGAAEIWHNGVEVRTGTPSSPGFDWTILRLFGNTETSLPFLGDCGGIVAWNSYLTDAQLQGAFTTMQSRLEQTGHQTGRGDVILLPEGDSRTAAFSVPQGPTYAFLMYQPAYTDGVQQFGGNFSQSGDGIDDVEGDVPQVVRSITNAVAMGRVPVASLLIGVNDSTLVVADPAAYFARIEAVLQAYKDAGAKVVAITELPKGSAAGGGTGSAWETARATLRSSILASSVPDAVADFGDPATTMGDPDGPDTDPTNWDDDLHPTAAGHALLAPVFWDAIKLALS